MDNDARIDLRCENSSRRNWLMKKFISVIIALSMLVTLAMPAMATDVDNCESFAMEIDGEEVLFSFSERNGVRYVSYVENGERHVASYNLTTGVLMHDNSILSVIEPTAELDVTGIDLESVFSIAARRWVEYDRDEGDITSDVISIAGWVATIGAFLGSGIVFNFQDAVEDLARSLVQLALPTVYYTQIMYYDANSTSSRPQTGSEYIFYSLPTRREEDEIGRLDLRIS